VNGFTREELARGLGEQNQSIYPCCTRSLFQFLDDDAAQPCPAPTCSDYD